MRALNSSIIGSDAVRTAVLALVSVATGGCDGCNSEWKTVSIKTGSQACRVVVYSPPYGKNACPPDTVAVLWDGGRVFGGLLPTRTSGPDGFPVELLNILCSPGDHILEVRTDTGVLRQNVGIKNNQTLYYKIFGLTKDGKETIIEDMGDNPGLE